jgi:hypothetical protein
VQRDVEAEQVVAGEHVAEQARCPGELACVRPQSGERQALGGAVGSAEP